MHVRTPLYRIEHWFCGRKDVQSAIMLLHAAARTSFGRNVFSAVARASMASKAANVVPLVLGPHEVFEQIQHQSQRQEEQQRQQRQQQKRPIRLLDATWFMPNVQRNAYEEFLRKPRLPGASFWDVDKVATHKTDVDERGQSENPLGLSHMMPSAKTFSHAAGAMGITPSTHVVVYDTHGVFSSPRTAFTFFAFGHPAISILDGGLPGWRAAGLPLEEGTPYEYAATTYAEPALMDGLVRSYDEMVANARIGARGQTVLDARPYGRYAGTSPEPRAGLASGHIPNSLSLPASGLLDVQRDVRDSTSTFTTLKSQTDLWRTFVDALGQDGRQDGLEALDKLRQASSAAEPALTNTCGSGMTAAILWLGLSQLGIQSSIYDESWTGYASRNVSVIDVVKSDNSNVD